MADILNYRSPEATPASLYERAAQVHATGRALRVTAVEFEGGALAITGVSPVSAAVRPGSPGSPYHLEARDSGGTILASVPVDATPTAGGALTIAGAVTAPAEPAGRGPA